MTSMSSMSSSSPSSPPPSLRSLWMSSSPLPPPPPQPQPQPQPQSHSIDTLPPAVRSFLQRLGLTTTTAFLAVDSTTLSIKLIETVLLTKQRQQQQEEERKHGRRRMIDYTSPTILDSLSSSSTTNTTNNTTSVSNNNNNNAITDPTTFPLLATPTTATKTAKTKKTISIQDVVKIVDGWKQHVFIEMERRKEIRIRHQQQRQQQHRQRHNLQKLVLRQQQILHESRMELVEQQQKQKQLQSQQQPCSVCVDDENYDDNNNNNNSSSSINHVTQRTKALPFKKRLKFDTSTTTTAVINGCREEVVATLAIPTTNITNTDDDDDDDDNLCGPYHRDHRHQFVHNLYQEEKNEESSNVHLRMEPLVTKDIFSKPLGIHLDNMSSTPGDLSYKDGGAVVIVEPNKNDVLNGRGGATNKHPGNITYRSLVRRCREFYRTRRKHTKMMVARSIVRTIANFDEPGRFLDAVKTSEIRAIGKVWKISSDRRAVDKVSQALREQYTIVPEDEKCRQVMELVAITLPDRKEVSVEMAVRAVALMDLTVADQAIPGAAAVGTQPIRSSISEALSYPFPSHLPPPSDQNGTSKTSKPASRDDYRDRNRNPSEKSEETSGLRVADSHRREEKHTFCPPRLRKSPFHFSCEQKEEELECNKSFVSPDQVQKSHFKMKSLSMNGRKRAASSEFVDFSDCYDDDDDDIILINPARTTGPRTTNMINSTDNSSDSWTYNWW